MPEVEKSLYGLAQSLLNYFLYNKGKFIKMGLYQSNTDPCLFILKDVIVLTYVDNALYYYKDKLAISDLKGKIVDKGIYIREENSVAGYLCVHIDWKRILL